MDEPNDCGCCAGSATETPGSKVNRPALPALVYRVGTHASFRSSLLARLSSTDFPALAPLTTRDDDDWTIALCDAFATLGDVLTFYQERIANEAFLRTAVERRSVLELARLVGYKLAPGVAASTSLAFMLEVPLVQPAPAPQPVTVPAGTRVQSVPDAEQDPQTFETTAPIVARAEWNALGVQTSQRELPYLGQQTMWLQGTATQLQPGDVLLLVGAARELNVASTAWNLRWIDEVALDNTLGLTRVRWSVGLSMFAARGVANDDGVRVFALRQRAALFGHNAPDPNLVIPDQMPQAQKDVLVSDVGGGVLGWNNYAVDTAGRVIDLDAVHPKMVIGSWFVLVDGTAVELHRVAAARQISRSAFGLSGKLTRLTPAAGEAMVLTNLQNIAVHGHSEELALAERPLPQPMFGTELPLASVQPLLANEQRLALSGRRQRVAVSQDPAGVSFPADPARIALPGESFIVAAPPVKLVGIDALATTPADLDPESGFEGLLRWTLLDRDGAAVTIEADAGVLELQVARADDPVVDEVAFIDDEADAIVHDHDRTTLRLAAALVHCYDRSTVTVNANVAPATHGETVGEIAGSGDASLPSQRFRLRQSPLTYVAADNPQGRESTLQVRVNDLRWDEVSTLYSQPRTARVYALRQDDEGRTTVQFGDGIEGARLPSGSDNLRLSYRKGLGAAGNVRAGTITTLVSRPVGVKGAVNPVPATGGEDAEALADARRNAPLTVLTLDRAVSILDYADFARAFAGIAKATTIWIEGGAARGVHLTVAGIGGAAVETGSDTHDKLLKALRGYGDALLPLTLQSYVAATFELEAKVKVDRAFDTDDVIAAVDAAVRAAFAFDARDFGQPVTFDEVLAVAHGVEGVLAVDIDRLHRSGFVPGPRPEPRLFPVPALIQPDGVTVSAAELLTLAGLTLGTMP